MVRVTKKQIEKGIRDAAWNRFLSALKAAKSAGELRKILASFLTPTELTMLEKRLAIPVLAARGLSYRKIGELLDVSSNTISFVKNKLVWNPLRD